jgi:hypothetical protein
MDTGVFVPNSSRRHSVMRRWDGLGFHAVVYRSGLKCDVPAGMQATSLADNRFESEKAAFLSGRPLMNDGLWKGVPTA